MSEILTRVQALVRQDQVKVSRHGFREIAADDILLIDAITGLHEAVQSRNTPDMSLALASSSFKMTGTTAQFICFGEYRKAKPLQPC